MSVIRRTLWPASTVLAGLLPGLAVLGACVALGACATTAPEAPRPHIPDLEAAYFIDPLVAYPLAAPGELEIWVRQGFAVLRSGGDLAALESSAESLLERDPGFHAGRVLLAQVTFLQGESERALELLSPVADELPGYLPCQILLGRVAEKLGDLPRAFEAFQRAAGSSSVAGERAAELEPSVVEILLQRVEDLLDRGHLEEAGRQLEDLGAWAGERLPLVRLQRDLAYAEGDVEKEMEVLKRLVDLESEDPDVAQRLAELYLISGDIRSAIDMLEQLVTQRPDDAELTAKLELAKFRWRLQLLPAHVREVASKGVLSRAELATMLYWLDPSVRYAEVTDPPIATDILDHPQREEILPVMFLELIPVDETLHLFFPERPATRALTLRSLLGLLALSQADHACLDAAELRAVAVSQSLVCRKSAHCRLIREPAECLPQAEISGPDALDLFRRTLDLVGSR